ncbi:enoyl-CoA hydratase/isomerase family protein [Falsigemmobacter faecalis]|nr:enoyl-CoA hydratase-related protein [Falsigemmobacter faecalis]
MSAISLHLDQGLAILTLSAPGRKNALDQDDWKALRVAIAEVAQGPARALLLRGVGGDFCAGFDLSGIRPGETDAFEVIDGLVNPALQALRALPIPTLAAVEGSCVGGGLGLAAACDLMVLSETARLGAPYAAIGFLCDAGLHVFLRETLGYQRAAWLIFTGKLLQAGEAFACGLGSVVLPGEGFAAATEAQAHALAAGPDMALRLSKQILRTARSPEEGLLAEALGQARIFNSSDAAEGGAAFLAGRPPRFEGR